MRSLFLTAVFRYYRLVDNIQLFLCALVVISILCTTIKILTTKTYHHRMILLYSYYLGMWLIRMLCNLKLIRTQKWAWLGLCFFFNLRQATEWVMFKLKIWLNFAVQSCMIGERNRSVFSAVRKTLTMMF